MLGDDAIDLVLISTRHDSHAALALRALEAGKNVFVEKPLALTRTELAAIEAFYAGRADGPLLMTGFNRRFSPAVVRLRELLAGRTSPLVANYRMNAGYIPLDHWVHGPEGGGRNIGEACHVYDVFDFLVERRRDLRPGAGDRRGEPALGGQRQLRRHDRLRRRLGLHAHLHGARPPRPPEGAARRLSRAAASSRSTTTSRSRSTAAATAGGRRRCKKGHIEELEALARALREGGPWPIPLEQQLQATRISFAVERQLKSSAMRLMADAGAPARVASAFCALDCAEAASFSSSTASSVCASSRSSHLDFAAPRTTCN